MLAALIACVCVSRWVNAFCLSAVCLSCSPAAVHGCEMYIVSSRPTQYFIWPHLFVCMANNARAPKKTMVGCPGGSPGRPGPGHAPCQLVEVMQHFIIYQPRIKAGKKKEDRSQPYINQYYSYVKIYTSANQSGIAFTVPEFNIKVRKRTSDGLPVYTDKPSLPVYTDKPVYTGKGFTKSKGKQEK